MLKRYQVLLNDWIEDYVKFVAKRYDTSSSAVIRVHMALGIIFVIKTLQPEYKPNLEDREFQKLAQKAAKGKLGKEEAHQLLSRILFEARKAVEHRSSVNKEQKK